MTALAQEQEQRTLPAEELAVGLRILADLLESGMPLSRVLQAFAGIAPARWRDAAPALLSGVREGRGLSRSLEASPLEIPPIVLGLIRAGESGSGLTDAVGRAAEHAEAVASTRASLQSALAYPLLVACVGVVAMSILLGVVLPRFGAVLADLGQQLPPSTRLLLDIANAVKRWGPTTAILGVLGSVGLAAWLRRPEGRLALDETLLRLPGIGGIRRSAATARFTASLSAMLESGVSLRSGLRQVEGTVGDRAIAARIAVARKRIDGGEPLARALEESAVVTPFAARLIAAGDESGRLPGMLAFAARLEQSRADRETKTTVRLIEPALILSFAALVGLVAAAMLQAIYAVRPV